MMNYFTVSPANDPCVIKSLERVFLPSQLSTRPNLKSEVFLVGDFSLSNHFLKFDKTVPTNV